MSKWSSRWDALCATEKCRVGFDRFREMENGRVKVKMKVRAGYGHGEQRVEVRCRTGLRD